MNDIRKQLRHLFYTTSSFVHHFKFISEFKLELQSGNTQFGSKLVIFCPVWPWNLMDDLEKHRAPLLYYIKLCVAFHNQWYIQTGVTVGKRPIRVKIGDFFVPHDLENWRMTLKNNRTPLLCCFKLRASFQSHWWIQTGVTVRKRQIWVKICGFLSRVTLKFDGWP